MQDICAVCGHNGETARHVLIFCPIARDCWRRISYFYRELSAELHSISYLVILVKSLKGKHGGEA